VVGNRGGRQLGDRRRGIASLRFPAAGIDRRGNNARQLGRVGVEAETDLTAALLDERREPIREVGQLGPSL
jgi:hypothetical protein